MINKDGKLICPHCHCVLKQRNVVLTSYPVQFQYYCPKCNYYTTSYTSGLGEIERINWTNGVQRATQKLGQLEDIEEELGIDLVKLLSAKSIFVDEKYGHVSVFYDFKISVIEQCVYVSVDDCDDTKLSFDDYGKTWAFTKEQLKNDRV